MSQASVVELPGDVATDAGCAARDDAPNGTAAPARRSLAAALLELSKARLNALVLVTTLVGFLLAGGGQVDWLRLVLCLVGTGLAAFGANALNQCLEAERDGRMLRTRHRPLPAGELSLSAATRYAILCACAGPLVLWVGVHWLPALLAASCCTVYVLIYTPLKTRTTWNTLVGAVCGALPPMIGWAAARESIEFGAAALGAILFVWQIPHFLALAWMYREDYERGGFRMLPQQDPGGAATGRAIVVYSVLLAPIALLLPMGGLAGWLYAGAALLLTAGLCWYAVQFLSQRTQDAARRVFLASVIYLPVLLLFALLDR